MDDATSEIYGAFFVCQEGAWSSFRGVREVLDKKGGNYMVVFHSFLPRFQRVFIFFTILVFGKHGNYH